MKKSLIRDIAKDAPILESAADRKRRLKQRGDGGDDDDEEDEWPEGYDPIPIFGVN